MQGGGGAQQYPNSAQAFSRGLGDGLSVTYTLRTDSHRGTTLEAQFKQTVTPAGSRISREDTVLTIKARYNDR